MEKTKKEKASERQPSRQAPVGTWSPENLKQALSAGTTDEKVAMLTELGILTQDGKLAPRYKNWGDDVVSRTEEEAAHDG